MTIMDSQVTVPDVLNEQAFLDMIVRDLKCHLKKLPAGPKCSTLRRTLRLSKWTKYILGVRYNETFHVYIPSLVAYVYATSKDRPAVRPV